MLNPEAGDVIPGTSGLRKLRFADEKRSKGKRGGMRVIYYWWDTGSQFWLFTVFDKDEMSDLTASERKALKEMIKRELEARRKTMKRAIKTKPKRGAARDLFAELREGMEALTDARQGKRTLRTHAMEFRPAPKITPQELIRLRRSLKLSRALFAVYLRTNVRTLENWEQGRAKPNAQAALLINLVKRYPDTVERLAAL
jgi:putative transcriptional regulator